MKVKIKDQLPDTEIFQLVDGEPQKNKLKDTCWGISPWLYEFRPGNKTIYVVFDEESEFSGPRTWKKSLDQVF